MLGTALALAVVVGVPAALPFTWLGPLAAAAVRACSLALLLGFTVAGLAVLYRFAPSRAEPKWRWVTPGALLAAGLWLLGSGPV